MRSPSCSTSNRRQMNLRFIVLQIVIKNQSDLQLATVRTHVETRLSPPAFHWGGSGGVGGEQTLMLACVSDTQESGHWRGGFPAMRTRPAERNSRDRPQEAVQLLLAAALSSRHKRGSSTELLGFSMRSTKGVTLLRSERPWQASRRRGEWLEGSTCNFVAPDG